jgi:tRNA(Ile)-lysidine synthetase-like protein
LPVSVDETNADRRYRRNAVRTLLRGLEAVSPGSTRAIARGAALIAEDKSLLDGLTLSAWKRSAARGAELSASSLRKLPMPLLRRVLRYAVRQVAGTARDFSYDHCSAIARAVKDRRGGVYHAGAVRAVLSGARLALRPREIVDRAASQGQRLRVKVPKRAATFAWGGGQIKLRCVSDASLVKPRLLGKPLLLDGTILKPGVTLCVRYPEAGDKIVPSGRRTPVALSRFLAKEGLSREERATVPLLCHNDVIVAALGVRSAASCAAAAHKNVLEVRWTPPNVPSSSRTADEYE